MSWRDEAECRLHEPSLFEYRLDDGETVVARRRRNAAAKRVCVGCPVRGECLADAVPGDEGVRAGLLLGPTLRCEET